MPRWPARRSTSTGPRRRTGPSGEAAWWDPEDQAFAERPVVRRHDLGKGWQSVPMVNNVERLDPFVDDVHSGAVRAARAHRRLTALDEGTAWRRRSDGALLVVRVEVFADGDGAGHRAAWQAHGTEVLDAVWRERWRERDRSPGWIEARWHVHTDHGAPEEVDWIVVEDHTGAAASGAVIAYDHLSLWAGRTHATLTIRHDQASDLAAVAGGAAAAALARLRQLDA